MLVIQSRYLPNLFFKTIGFNLPVMTGIVGKVPY